MHFFTNSADNSVQMIPKSDESKPKQKYVKKNIGFVSYGFVTKWLKVDATPNIK